MFYGRECLHCKAMLPFVEQIEKEGKGKVKFRRLELWHDKKNVRVLDKVKQKIKVSCNEQLLIPIFYYEKSRKILCGQKSYDDLKSWVDSL